VLAPDAPVAEHPLTGHSLSLGPRMGQVGHFVRRARLLPLPSVMALARLEVGRQDATVSFSQVPSSFSSRSAREEPKLASSCIGDTSLEGLLERLREERGDIVWPALNTVPLATSAAWKREREWLWRQPLTVAESYLRALRWFDPPPPAAWPREVEALVSQRQRSLPQYHEHARDRRMSYHRAG
jgi:hypothetical protein